MHRIEHKGGQSESAYKTNGTRLFRSRIKNVKINGKARKAM